MPGGGHGCAACVPGSGGGTIISSSMPINGIGNNGCTQEVGPIICPDLGCAPCMTNTCCLYRGADHCLYGNLEYLLWFTKDMYTPPLVTTTSDPTGLAILGQNGTQVLFGGDIDMGIAHGGRFRVGWLFDCDRLWAIEAGGLFLMNQVETFTASSTGNPFLARPIYVVSQEAGVTGEGIEQVANPDVPNNVSGVPVFALNGSVEVKAESQLMGFEINGRRNICFGCNDQTEKYYHIDLLAGFRYLQLREKLSITENLTVPATFTDPISQEQVLAGTGFAVQDRFFTDNDFYGGQIGFEAECRWRRWVVDLTGKIAMGYTSQNVEISGNTTTTIPGQGSNTQTGGMLAQPSNIGSYSRDTFTMIPEVGITLGYQICNTCKVYAGYNVLYWGSVARPGDQIDRTVSDRQVPRFGGGNVTPVASDRPLFTFRESSYWAQGLTLGLELKY
jgi:hypothetical protein